MAAGQLLSHQTHCSMEKGDNDAFLYHLGDAFSKAFDSHQADLVHSHMAGYSLHTPPHVTETETLHCNEIGKIINIIYKFTQIYTRKIKFHLYLSWVAF
jgi:hypothetical protein